MSSNSGNRSKALFGFGAIVAVLIVAILVWPSNVRKEDASGAIGAVQKHHAPQITQQDVVLGGEQVKAQQKILYTDFLADAGKLRSLANENAAAARTAFAREVRSRWVNVAQQAARTYGDQELNVRLQKQAELSAEEMQQYAMRLGEANSEKIKSHINAISLADINLNDEQLLSQRLGEIETNLASIDRDMEMAARRGYLGMLAEEEALMARGSAADFEALAVRLESQAKANEEMFVNDESALAQRLHDVDATLGTRYSSAAVMGNTVRGSISQAAMRIGQRANRAQTTLNALNASAR